jgi:hypothetical protein
MNRARTAALVGAAALFIASMAQTANNNTPPAATPHAQTTAPTTIPMADGDNADIPDVLGALDDALLKTFGGRDAWMKAAQEDVNRLTTVQPTVVRPGRILAHGFLTTGVMDSHVTESGDDVIVTNYWDGAGALTGGDQILSFPGIAGGFLASDPTTGYLLLAYEVGRDGARGVPIEFLLPSAGAIQIEAVTPTGQVGPSSWQGGTAQVRGMKSKVAYTIDLSTAILNTVPASK